MKVCDELLESKPGVGTLDVCTTMAMAAKCMHNSSSRELLIVHPFLT